MFWHFCRMMSICHLFSGRSHPHATIQFDCAIDPVGMPPSSELFCLNVLLRSSAMCTNGSFAFLPVPCTQSFLAVSKGYLLAVLFYPI